MHNRDIMRENDHVIVLMPSGTKKMVKLTPGSKIQLGKFGSCVAEDLIGQLFDIEYDIERDSISRTQRQQPNTQLSSTARNNQHINDSQSAQSLNQEQILELKAECLKGDISTQQLVDTLVANSVTFTQKSDFAQAKYIKKKEKKFLKSFTPLRPTAANLCTYFLAENAQKTMEMRVDTLSQMMSFANVHAGARFIVCEETQGLILGSVMERMGGVGEVLVVHEKEKERHIVAEYMNFGKEWETVNYLHYSRLGPHPDEDVDVESLPKTPNWEARNAKITNAVNKVLHARSLYTAGGFDGLVMCVQANPLPLILELAPKLASSRPVVLFSQFKEQLLPTYLYLRQSPLFVNVTLTESWMREYQVPLHLVGTHPMMTMGSSGGYVLTGVRVNVDGCVDSVSGTKSKLPRGKKQRRE